MKGIHTHRAAHADRHLPVIRPIRHSGRGPATGFRLFTPGFVRQKYDLGLTSDELVADLNYGRD